MKNKNKLKQEKDKVYINNDFTSQKRDRKKEQERSNQKSQRRKRN